MSETESEQLAERMLYRDRPESGDDRRICLKCKEFVKGACSLARRGATGLIPVWNVLQRCGGFSLRGAA